MGIVNTMRQSGIILILVILCQNIAHASWMGPNVIVQGGWGTGETEFGLIKGEIADDFPKSFYLLSDGKIAIEDGENLKLKIFSSDGMLMKSLDLMGFGFFELSSNKFVIAKKDHQRKTMKYSIGLYDLLQQKWLWVDQDRRFSYNPDILVDVSIDGSYFTVWSGVAGYKYSASGILLETYTTKPLIFGQVVSSGKLLDNQYSTIIKFDDATYGCKTPTPVESVTRDKEGFLYGITQVGIEKKDLHARTYKITKCGKVIGTIDFPPNKSHFSVSSYPPATDIVTVDEEYGQPVISATGDVYTWKRTPDKYSILKWTWVDDPNVPTGPEPPTGLSLTPSINGLYLTWQASPNDPGCVTKYEIARSTTSGGSFSTLDTVEKGVLKYNDTTAETGTTYYYKVRAMAGSDPSLYTAEVSGKR